jgi:hypothetical protein
MRLRKLTTDEAARLCGCGLYPTESGHDRQCPHWLAGRRAHWQRCSQRWRERQRALRGVAAVRPH